MCSHGSPSRDVQGLIQHVKEAHWKELIFVQVLLLMVSSEAETPLSHLHGGELTIQHAGQTKTVDHAAQELASCWAAYYVGDATHSSSGLCMADTI